MSKSLKAEVTCPKCNAMYNAYSDRLKDRIPDMRKPEPCIDRDWAFKAFRTVLNEG